MCAGVFALQSDFYNNPPALVQQEHSNDLSMFVCVCALRFVQLLDCKTAHAQPSLYMIILTLVYL